MPYNTLPIIHKRLIKSEGGGVCISIIGKNPINFPIYAILVFDIWLFKSRKFLTIWLKKKTQSMRRPGCNPDRPHEPAGLAERGPPNTIFFSDFFLESDNLFFLE